MVIRAPPPAPQIHGPQHIDAFRAPALGSDRPGVPRAVEQQAYGTSEVVLVPLEPPAPALSVGDGRSELPAWGELAETSA